MTGAESFYVRDGDGRYTATELTRGPWDAGAQHAGPPAALLGYAIENRDGSRRDMRIARIAFTIVKPVPIAALHVTTTVIRAGRGTEVVAAELAPAGPDGTPLPAVMRAEAVLIRVAPGTVPAVGVPRPDHIAPPDVLDATLTAFQFDVGYHTAMETRYARGSFHQPGPASVWFRMRYPLIAGVPISPLSRVLTAADSGNGVSLVLSPSTHLFVNPELTVHLHRYPHGDWVCLDAVTMMDGDGIGYADTALYDPAGQIGRGAQSLYVAPRS